MIHGNIKDNKKWNMPKMIFWFFSLVMVYLYGLLVFTSLFYELLYGSNIQEFANNRSLEKQILKPSRGTIYDINENPLAITVKTYKLYAYINPARTTNNNQPKHVVDKELTAKKISEILDADYNFILKRLNIEYDPNNQSSLTYFGKYGDNISELKKSELDALALPGLGYESVVSRNYPNGNFASYIVGYTTKENKKVTVNDYSENLFELKGELGIEDRYNDILKGEYGYLEYQKTKQGLPMPNTKRIQKDETSGSDIYLTIDSGIQRFVESAMIDLKEYANPEWAHIHVMNAKTGAILATSAIPSFNPNIKDITNYENPLVSYSYEPGSTMKIYSFMCAMENNKYNGQELYKSGTYTVGDDTISDWNKKGWGDITYDKGFAYSSNVAAANLVHKNIGRDDYYKCLEKYGFGTKTNIKLPREQTGTLAFTYPIEVVASSYGQGITTTPIQNLQALSIIANNGTMVKPYIVSKIVDSKGNITYQNKKEANTNLVSSEVIKKIKELMYDVIYLDDKNATGALYKNNNIAIIGKTGTAQYIEKNGSYTLSGYRYIYSFAGMFPKEDPEIIIYASMKKPNQHASLGLAKAINSIVNSITKYKNLTINKNNDFVLIDSYYNQNSEYVLKELINKGLNPILIGDGNKVINILPNTKKLIKGDKIFIITNYQNITLPKLNNWSLNDVLTIADILGYQVEHTGNGYVKQYEVVDKKIILKLEDKYKIGG